MFAGHIGVALAIGRAERRVNVGALIAAALLLDIALWTFVLLGWESVAIPPDFAQWHQPEFKFPLSHGLAAALAWSTAAAGLASALRVGDAGTRGRIAMLIALAVFSHWLLDALVHRPEVPLLGATSTVVGLSLWNHMTTALIAEAALVVIGLWLFLKGSSLPRGRSIGLATLVLVTLAFTVVGMTVAPPPPSASAMAASSLVTLAILCGLCFWLGAKRGAGPTP